MSLSLIQVSLGLLTILSSSLAWYPPWTPDHYFNCFEYDDVPVDTRIRFPGDYCQDKMGNKYHVTKPDHLDYNPAQQTSCCQCLEYNCKYLVMCDFEDPDLQKRCLDVEYNKKERYVFWNTSVSDNCCLYCNNTVYKADTVIDTTKLEDECQSEETHVCRKIPDLEKAKIESEFRYGVCCNDDVGLQPVKTTALQPSTCSERECIRPKNTPFAVWISRPIPGLEGCDCCKVDTGKEWILIEDKGEITLDGETFECCRGELVKVVKQGKKAQEKEFNKE